MPHIGGGGVAVGGGGEERDGNARGGCDSGNRFTEAIIFAKVTFITQRADVQFSDPLTVTFSPGVEARLVNDSKDGSWDDVQQFEDDAGDVAEKAAEPSLFLVISFGIANTMHRVAGTEIITASLNVAVIIENARHKNPVSKELAGKIKQDWMARQFPQRGRSNKPRCQQVGW